MFSKKGQSIIKGTKGSLTSSAANLEKPSFKLDAMNRSREHKLPDGKIEKKSEL